MGLSPATEQPDAPSARTRASATKLLPTPVPVPRTTQRRCRSRGLAVGTWSLPTRPASNPGAPTVRPGTAARPPAPSDHTLTSAAPMRSISSSSMFARNVTRILALPPGTVGGRIACPRTPSGRSAADASSAALSGPKTMGNTGPCRPGGSGTPAAVSTASSRVACRARRARAPSALRSSPRCSRSRSQSQGLTAVEKTKLRARFQSHW
jgi:hypothetical protein